MATKTKNKKKLRILFVSEFFFPRIAGAEVWSWDLCAGLAAHGHNVTVITSLHDDSPKTERKEGVRILRLNAAGTGRISRKLSAIGLAREVNKWLAHNKVDIVHVNAYTLNVAVSKIAAKRHIPCITSAHSYFGNDWRLLSPVAPLLRRLERSAIANDTSQALHVPSQFLAKRITHDVPHATKRLRVIHNWLPQEFPAPRPLPRKTVLFVGSLEAVKNPLACIPVAKRLGAHLLVVGTGSLADKLQEEALRQHVHMTIMGETTRDETLGLIGGASLVLIPSVTESFSLVALESVAQGTPVSGTSVGIMPELPGVIKWPPQRVPPRLSTTTQRVVRKQFSKEKGITAFEKLYAQVIARNI